MPLSYAGKAVLSSIFLQFNKNLRQKAARSCIQAAEKLQIASSSPASSGSIFPGGRPAAQPSPLRPIRRTRAVQAMIWELPFLARRRAATAAQRWPRATPPYAQWPMKTPVRARVVRLRGRTAILKAFSVCFCGEFHSVKAPETRSKYALQKQGHGMDFSHRRALAHGRALR